MILTKELDVFICNSNKKKYISKGYNIIENGIYTILIEDIPLMSNLFVDIQCDNCGKFYKTKYSDYNKKRIMTDYCQDCVHIKKENSIIEKYGVKNIAELDFVKEKKKQTLLDKYGVEYTWQSEEIRNKVITTNLERYGEIHPITNKEIRNKAKISNLEKYGVEYPFQNKDIFQKAINSQIEKYGKVGRTINTSSQQIYLNNIFGGELNYYIEPYHADIFFEKENIVCEYDGLGHNIIVKLGKLSQEEFDKKEKQRSNYLQEKGYKEFHIIADKKDNLPSDEVLFKIKEDAFDYLINQNGSYYSYNLETKEINKN